MLRAALAAVASLVSPALVLVALPNEPVSGPMLRFGMPAARLFSSLV
jgi:hypothetical protein